VAFFNFFKEKSKKIYSSFTQQISSLFSEKHSHDNIIKSLQTILLTADTGTSSTSKVINNIKEEIQKKSTISPEEIKEALSQNLISILDTPQKTPLLPKVLLMVGVNGTGKTSFIAKFAQLLKNKEKKSLIVAGDTFRAAATLQLHDWAKKIGVDIFIGKENYDPSSVIFDACKKFNNEHFDHLLIDTAGRLQTKKNLMAELEKIKRVIMKNINEQDNIKTWLTIDAMLGQNSLRQAEVFNKATNLDGIVLTKLDGTGKGGIVFGIADKYNVPITYITFGESLENIKEFNTIEYVKNLLH
jgi:fused signal recognition particle receptor